MQDKALKVFIVLLMTSAVITVARSGHELPVYPSYYPHEIEIRTMPAADAPSALREAKIQAYIGEETGVADALASPIRNFAMPRP